MAEGGGYKPNETPWEDHGIDHDDDGDDAAEEYKTPLSSPIKPPPPPPPEDIEMRQLPREQNGGRRQQAAWVALKKMYPQANKDALEVSYVKMPGKKTPRLAVKRIGAPRAYWLFEKDFLGRWRENPDLPPEIENLLGKSIEEQIKGFKQLKAKKEATRAAKQKQDKQLEQMADEKQKLSREMDSLTNQIRDLDEHKRELEDVHGSLDTEAIQKLKDEKRVLEGEKKNIQQQISQLEKEIIDYNTKQEEVNQLRHETEELDQHRNELEREVEELNRKIEEDKQLIDDENTSPSERAAAEARVAENEAELDRVNAELEARERERPLLERIKDIFKKYGWTLQALVLAVGVILGVIALAAKKGTKVVSQKLNDVKQQPGFIGSIVNFLFKAASQVFSFLSEHTWVLILVGVAFFMEKMLKRRRK